MYKIILQNNYQYYFSLQNHLGRRLSLSLEEVKIYKGLSREDANFYLKFIPLGLSVIIQPEDVDEKDFIADPNIEIVEQPVEIEPEVVEDAPVVNYSREDLESLKKAQLKEIATQEGLKTDYMTKAEILEVLVAHYGI